MDCHKYVLLWLLVIGFDSGVWGLTGFDDSSKGLCYEHVPFIRTRTAYRYVRVKICTVKYGSTCFREKYKKEPRSYIETYEREETRTVCCAGFVEHREKCQPTCSSECENGFCSDVNTCTCEQGYKKVRGAENICSPICSSDCVNGQCSKPETCTCHTGYKLSENKYMCKPSCQEICQNGVCTEPDYCTCHDGYKKSELNKYSCVPNCSKDCVNGKCVKPESCSCNSGYKLSSNNNYTCDPICSKECKHGKCFGPELCICDQGYIIDPLDKYKCKPNCSKECINAECKAPDSCSCYTGYKKKTEDPFTCDPICQDSCINAECVSPNNCSCLQGYVKQEETTNICVPYCSKGCLNGFCSAPEKCTCNHGYKKSNEKNKCEPVCSQECVNSDCKHPESCSCWLNYTNNLTNKYICEPVCSKPCINSKCETPETCTCEEGYIHTADEDQFTCIPHCNNTCVNSNCTNPGVCECFTGYEKDISNASICNPLCTFGCQNGNCINPEECSCRPGYKMTEHSHICQPVCTSCTNGFCSAPEICICQLGYENPSQSNSTCVPICDKSCINGKCVAPDVCSCNHGFVYSVQNLCSPYCSQGCFNGNCTAPEVCDCHSGYEMNISQNKCVPVCSEGCINGVCTAPENCSCFWGYQQSTKCADEEEPLMKCSLRGIIPGIDKLGKTNFFHDRAITFSLDNCNFFKFLLMKHATISELQTIPKVLLTLNCSSIDMYNNNSMKIIEIGCELVYVTLNNLNDTADPTSSFEDDFKSLSLMTEPSPDASESDIGTDMPFSDELKPEYLKQHFNEYFEEVTTPGGLELDPLLVDNIVSSTPSHFEKKSSGDNNKGAQSAESTSPTSCFYQFKTNIFDIKVNNTLFITDKGITADFFHGIQDVPLENTWCICSDEDFNKICSTNFLVRFHMCSCEEEHYKYQRPGEQFMSVRNHIVPIIITLGLALFLAASVYIYTRCYRSRHYSTRESKHGENKTITFNENEMFMNEEAFQFDNEGFCVEILESLRSIDQGENRFSTHNNCLN